MFDFISHYGVAHDEDPPGRGSGRFEWGSGENPEQHDYSFLGRVERERARGLKDAEIAKALLGEHATVASLKARIAVEKKREYYSKVNRAKELYNKYGSATKVAIAMGMSASQESTVRGWLKDSIEYKQSKYENTADKLKDIVDKSSSGIIDVSGKTELYLGVTDSTKKAALEILKEEGYKVTTVKRKQPTTGNETSIKVLARPDVEWKDVYNKNADIQSIVEFSPDGGATWFVPEQPSSIDHNRVFIRWGGNGGSDRDGTMELRPGVPDISLGDSMYAQVRVMVDGKAYMKGMALYSNDIPEGYDIIYNTNKKEGTKLFPEYKDDKAVFKYLNTDKDGNVDKDNPFGATIKKQEYYEDKNGKYVKEGDTFRLATDKDKGKELYSLSPVNKLTVEGDWSDWTRRLSKQMLEKQPIKLINQQLDYTISEKRAELDTIRQISNPVVRKKMLENFAGSCDSNATDLSALGFREQKFQVMLPLPEISDKEVYAPQFKDGDEVALIRYPHAGIFEIPVLKVNNKYPKGKETIGQAKDAIGISKKNFEILSGADADGDTALVIPCASNGIKINSMKPLNGLVGFEPKELYSLPESAPRIKNRQKQIEMGKVTNLIEDMTIQGADYESEVVRAVKHSMVVIDSEKHHLDYQQSYIDNNIRDLALKYQGAQNGKEPKASTILSRSKHPIMVNDFKEVNRKSDMTEEELKRYNEGYIIYHDTGKTIRQQIKNPKKMTEEELKLYSAGKKVYRDTGKLLQTKVKEMQLTDDAFTLVRDQNNAKEVAYANFANECKSLAREARKEARAIKPIEVNKQAQQTYAKEVESLKNKVRISEMNNPKERAALNLATPRISEKINANPDMDYEHIQRMRDQEMTRARAEVGAKKQPVIISDNEWKAIESGAVNTTLLTKIVNNAKQDELTKLAMPSKTRGLTTAQINHIVAMAKRGENYSDIAQMMNLSSSYISQIINENS